MIVSSVRCEVVVSSVRVCGLNVVPVLEMHKFCLMHIDRGFVNLNGIYLDSKFDNWFV